MSKTLMRVAVGLLLFTPLLSSAAVFSVPQPSASGDIVGLNLQNPTSVSIASRYVTLSEVFKSGAVMPTDSLVARINGTNTYVQMDVKTKYSDGSVNQAIITFLAPVLSANTTTGVMLAKGSASAPAPAPTASTLSTNGYNVSTTLAFQSTTAIPLIGSYLVPSPATQTFNANTMLSNAIGAGKLQTWLSGSAVNEYRVTQSIPGTSIRVQLDIRAYADGTTKTDVQINNDATETSVGGPSIYNETITQNGTTQKTWSSVYQYQYQDRNDTIWSNGAPTVNIQHDTAYLIATGAVPPYDLNYSATNINTNIAQFTDVMGRVDWGGALPNNGITKSMPDPGGRGDLGPTTQGNSIWLMSQDPIAAKFALAQADAAASVPWHLWDPTTGNYLSVFQYPYLWLDQRGGIGAPGGLTQWMDTGGVSDTHWDPESAHMPNLSYIPYLMTGEHRYLDEQNAQADFAIFTLWPADGARGQGSYHDIIIGPGEQLRGASWSIREIDQAAWANPDGSAHKTYFTQVMNDNWTFFATQLASYKSLQGETWGWMPTGFNLAGGINTNNPPWQNEYFASSLIAAVTHGVAHSKEVLDWASNFLINRFSPHTGWDPTYGQAYYMGVTDSTGAVCNTWAKLQQCTINQGNATGGVLNQGGDYAELSKMTLAGIYGVTSDPAALSAYNWLLAQNYPYFYTDPMFQFSTTPVGVQQSGGGTTPAPGVTLTANPRSLAAGQSSTLTWSSTNATSCFGTGFTASATAGSVTVTPSVTTTYSISCTGTGGTGSASAGVTVTSIIINNNTGVLANTSFETPALGANFSYNTTGATWTFSPYSGIEGNGSVWGAPAAPDGVQSAFIQNQSGNNGSISQSFSISSGGSYSVSFKAALRGYQIGSSAETFSVSLDGAILGTYSPANTTSFTSYTAPSVTLASGSHTLTFTGNGPNTTTDSTVFIDAVALNMLGATPPPPPPPIPAPTPSFGLGARVKTTANLNIRAKPNAKSGKILCTQPAGSLGTIKGGPSSAQGYIWWNINFDTSCDGYAVQTYLTTNLAQIPTTPVAQGPVGADGTGSISHTLARGWSGPEVSVLQSLLQKLDHYTGKITGYFGPLTEESVKDFQSANNLAAVGIVGPQTRELLNRMEK
jgi:hypothetical protein